MKIKVLSMAAILLAFTTLGLAQSKARPKAKAAKATGPEQIVKDLYAAHKAKKGPFFQTKSRALVDKYFVGELGDLIWKDALAAKGEVGALDFDPLYRSQDPQITHFVIGKADENNMVHVTFKNAGKDDRIVFSLVPDAKTKSLKIETISYSDAEDLGSIIEYSMMTDAERTEHAKLQELFDGDYMVGTVKCNITSNIAGYWARVKCDDRENVQIIDTESMTFGTYVKNEKGRKGKFNFVGDHQIVSYVDEKGKVTPVTRLKKGE